MPSFLTGIYGYLAAALLAAIISAGGTYYIVHTANAVTISNLKLQQSQAQTASVTASINKLTGFISSMNEAAAGYQSNLDTINANFADLKKGLSNAIKQTPLPVDCRPDASRLSILTAAVAAANNATNP
jgi:septal ring factor EnvC (AmiA/AmiB activator)